MMILSPDAKSQASQLKSIIPAELKESTVVAKSSYRRGQVFANLPWHLGVSLLMLIADGSVV
jgi:hypothetical protein